MDSFERNHRKYRCRKCGSDNTEIFTEANDAEHFPEVRYKRCGACGHEEVMRPRKKPVRLD